ncbi:MAG: ATP-dependent Clp protease proteolytic subunit [Patescibacteria group bacterium]
MRFSISAAKHGELVAKGKYLITSIDGETINALVSWIVNNRPAKTEFTILINSSGGAAGLVLYFASFVATLAPEVKIVGVAFGECGSAALALLQCCHERIGVRDCGFFVHHISLEFAVNCQKRDRKYLERSLAESRGVEEELVRLQCKRAGMSRRAWMKLADEGEEMKGRAILTPRALALGLIDKIVATYPVF